MWFSKSLIKMIKEKFKYHIELKKYKTISDYNSFCTLGERVKLLVKINYKDYITKVPNDVKTNIKHFGIIQNN